MKFARDFRDALASQGMSTQSSSKRVPVRKPSLTDEHSGFPEHWVDQAIPYGRLKKCLKKVQRELQELGLDPETLRALIDPDSKSPLALQYQLESMHGPGSYHLTLYLADAPYRTASSGSNLVRPRLTVDVHLQDGVVVDASLTPASRRFLEKLASDIAAEKLLPPGAMKRKKSQQSDPESEVDDDTQSVHRHDGDTIMTNPPLGTNCETIEVPLTFDGEFFDLLQNDVVNLDALQEQEQKKMLSEVEELGKEVAVVAKPSRFSKNDLARWRDIFELYLDAEIFFATHEQDHGARSSSRALKQLQLFQGEVEKRKLNKKFKLRESQVAFDRFLQLNASLLKNLQFQELNRLAVSKILKSMLLPVAEGARLVTNTLQSLTSVLLWGYQRPSQLRFRPRSSWLEALPRTSVPRCRSNWSMLFRS
jgi:hypothetical protein